MLFFKRILEPRAGSNPPDRRGAKRYAISPQFPMKAVLNVVGRDNLGQPLTPKDGAGWDWTGRLINLSSQGARMQVPPTVLSARGDACVLKFDLEGYKFSVPGSIAHVSERYDSIVYGLRLDTADDAVGEAYRQLLELIALGASLRPTRPSQADASGYLVEQYGGEESSTLTLWRQMAGRDVAAFEFQLKNCRVRGMAGDPGLQFLIGEDPAAAQPASPAQSDEIRRLFHWVVPNLPAAVPADVRDFLLQRAA